MARGNRMARVLSNLLLALALQSAEIPRGFPFLRQAIIRHQWYIIQYRAGDLLTYEWKSGIAKRELHKTQSWALKRPSERILLGFKPTVIDVHSGQDVQVTKDNELEEGVWSPYLNYRNRLWKLQLARAHDGQEEFQNKPLRIVVEMLGEPPGSFYYKRHPITTFVIDAY